MSAVGNDEAVEQAKRMLAVAASEEARSLELRAGNDGFRASLKWDGSVYVKHLVHEAPDDAEERKKAAEHGRLLIATMLSNTVEAPAVLDVRNKREFTIKGGSFAPEGVERVIAAFDNEGNGDTVCTLTLEYKHTPNEETAPRTGREPKRENTGQCR